MAESFRRLGGLLRAERVGRAPLVTLGLALVWITSQLVVEVGYSKPLYGARSELRGAVEYFIQHPMLRIDPRLLPVLRDAMPGYEGNEVFSSLSRRKVAGDGSSPQDEFDRRVRHAFGLLDGHPQRTLGVVPALPSYHGYLTHVFVHAGWWHLLCSLALLLSLGPLLERTWGRIPFAVSCLLLAVASSALYAFVSPSSDRPLIGGTALTVGLAAAVLARFREQHVDLAESFAGFVELELCVPAWTVGPVAAAAALGISTAHAGNLPPSVDVAAGGLASAVASVLGGGLALVYSKSRIESRFGRAPKSIAPRKPRPERFDRRRVEHARSADDRDTALEFLRAEAVRRPGNRDAVMAFWDVSVELRQAREAVPAVFRLIREEMRRGAMEVAAAQWGRVVDQEMDARLDPGVLAGLLPWIEKAGCAEKTVLALEHVVFREDRAKEALPASVAGDLALMAAELAPDVSETVARMALEGTGLSDERRAELEALLDRLAPQEPGMPSFQTPRGELPENVFYAEQDRSEFGQVEDLGGLLPDELAQLEAPSAPPPVSLFPGIRATPAQPVSLEPDALLIEVAGRGRARLAYSRILGVTLAGVSGIVSKPVALVDLLLTGPEPDGLVLEVVRLRGDQFDPRRFVSRACSRLDALKAFAAELVKLSRAVALPSASVLDPASRVEIYGSSAEYEERVLRVAQAEAAAG